MRRRRVGKAGRQALSGGEERVRSRTLTRRRFLTSAGAVVAFASCARPGRAQSGTPESRATRAFVDLTGATVQVPGHPERIVAVHDINAGVQVLSLGGPLVGMTSREDGATEAVTRYFDLSDIADVGVTYEPDLEAIVALQPDLIIGEGYNGAVLVGEDAILEQLRQIAPVVGIDTFRPVELVMADYAELLGDAATIDVSDQHRAFEERLDTLQALQGERWQEITASLVTVNSVGGGLEAWGPTALVELDIMTRVGVSWVPLMEEAGQPENGGYIGGISLERMSEFDADLIFALTAYGQEFLDDPLYLALPAVQAGQVVELAEELAGTHYPNYIFATDLLLDALRGRELRTDFV